jgi:hypothetical protein
MPIKRVQYPDGSIHRIEVPEGATDEQIIAFVQSQQKPAPEPKPAPAPKPMTFGENVKRTAGLGVRAAISGPLEFAGIFTDPAAIALGLGTARQGAQRFGDALGLPNPSTGAERVSQDVSKAISGGGGFLGSARLASNAPGLLGSVGRVAASQPVVQTVSGAAGTAAGSGAREAGVGPGGQVAAGLVGGVLPGVGLFGTQGALRTAVRGGQEGREAMAGPDTLTRLGIQGGNIANFRAAGTTASVGQAVGNRRMQGLESLLAGAPTSGGVMSKFAERQAAQIGEGLQGKAVGLSPAPSAERAGLAIQRGVDSFTGDVQAQRSALYAHADKLIPDTVRTPLTKTRAELLALTTPDPGAKNTTKLLINPRITALAENLEKDIATGMSGGIPYSTLKDLRSHIGRELSDFSLTVDRPTAEYKRLYAAMSEDMQAAAKGQGAAAQMAARRANDYFRASQKRLELLERVVDKAGGPEKVYQAALAGTTDGATTLRGVMRSLPQDGQRALTAAVVKRMGLATKGNQGADGDTFSAQTFLTNWNALSKEARSALFAPHGAKAGPFGSGGKFTSDMDKIAKVAESIRNGSKVYANPSGTANRGLAYGYLGALVTGALAGPGGFATVAGTGAGANILARAMVNPRFVSWLARSTELPASSAPQQIAALRGIAKDEKDEDLAALADQLERGQ